MSLLTVPKTAKWPFLVGDALLLGLAWFFCVKATVPFDGPTLATCVACVAIGALLGIAPFMMDYRAEIRFAESEGLAETVDQIRGLQTIAAAIASATGKWQGVHEQASSAADSARQVSEKMSEEMVSFMDFLDKAKDSERQHLALEVDKLKRAESDWLGVLVRILDHAYALRAAAIKSGQSKVVDQLTQFQTAIRDVARRVGLAAFEAEAGTEFDPTKHQLPNGGEVPAGSRIAVTMATGIHFRGQMIRPVIVELEGGEPATPADQPSDSPQSAEVDTSSESSAPEQQLAL
jgi:uncharacterized damage-inducible protein DinB